MAFNPLPLDQILHGNCVELLAALPEKSVDLIFADPPYNLQLRQTLWRPNMTRVAGVDDDWDQFGGFEEYDDFSRSWLGACRRVLKDNAAIWVIGTYHNIFRLGKIMQDLGYWLLNDIIWVKTNPMPNFRGVRFTNAHETLIWASKHKSAKYTFNHHAMKAVNEDKQMRSDWMLPLCSGAERIKVDGKKAHSTQKPEALLYRLILATSQPGDIILDPFFGSGTTGAVAKKLHRHWIGIERQEEYIKIARQRIETAKQPPYQAEILAVSDRHRMAPRVPFASLLEQNLLQPGEHLYFRQQREQLARIKTDGRLILCDGFEGSIHQAGSYLMHGSPCNGWEHWYYESPDGKLHVIEELRKKVRENWTRT